MNWANAPKSFPITEDRLLGHNPFAGFNSCYWHRKISIKGKFTLQNQ